MALTTAIALAGLVLSGAARSAHMKPSVKKKKKRTHTTTSLGALTQNSCREKKASSKEVRKKGSEGKKKMSTYVR